MSTVPTLSISSKSSLTYCDLLGKVESHLISDRVGYGLGVPEVVVVRTEGVSRVRVPLHVGWECRSVTSVCQVGRPVRVLYGYGGV